MERVDLANQTQHIMARIVYAIKAFRTSVEHAQPAHKILLGMELHVIVTPAIQMLEFHQTPNASNNLALRTLYKALQVVFVMMASSSQTTFVQPATAPV